MAKKKATKRAATAKRSAARGKKKPQGRLITVRATAQGYYGDAQRAIGEEFTIQDVKDFSETWMERV